MRTANALAWLFTLGCVLAAGCGTKPADPAKVDPAEKAAIETGPDGQLEALIGELEKSIGAGDIGSIEANWLLPDDLAGCQHGSAPVDTEKLTAFLEKKLQEFRDTAAVEMGEARRGSVLAVNKWSRPEPEIMDKKLSGDTCKATAFGRLNVVIKPDKAPPKVVEHRFNALYIGEQWKLFRYLPAKPTCTGPKAKENWLSCQKLAEAG
jgi:hypothetical protein